MSVHPRLGAMLISAQQLQACELGCVVASLINERDILRESASSADLGLRLYALTEALAGKPGLESWLQTQTQPHAHSNSNPIACQACCLHTDPVSVYMTALGIGFARLLTVSSVPVGGQRYCLMGWQQAFASAPIAGSGQLV